MNRSEIQARLEAAVRAALTSADLSPLAGPHVRRTIRALLRIAVGLAKRHGASLGVYMALAFEAYEGEAAAKVPARA